MSESFRRNMTDKYWYKKYFQSALSKYELKVIHLTLRDGTGGGSWALC